ncbi:hypothetical protein [Lewinella sp. 4G2]|uniref:hypothetical protein n=1 Tax=Lewinella sp. 4G2 TaxID=1803372 RepID=UPI0007B4EDAB|nr:hypothetical protein [Lewinella sp. 4G2]OAV46156.1 hypothetical protein A3850_018015 [Lewinella sp. 4G2]
MEAVLRAKNYVIGGLLLLPTLYGYFVSAKVNNAVLSLQEEDSEVIQDFFTDFSAATPYLIGFAALTLLGMIVYYVWAWSVANRFSTELPLGTNLKLSSVRSSLIGQFIATITLYGGVGYFLMSFIGTIAGLEEGGSPSEEYIKNLLYLLPVLVIGGLIAFAAQVYTAYWIGKALKSVELGRPAKGGEVAGYAILTYLLVIGAWILQPKINSFVETGEMEPGGSDNVW